MTTMQADLSQPLELKQAIQDRIAQRTKVHIPTLRVEVVGDLVVINGCVSSFYMKQLVIEGVLDAVGREGATRIELNVDVI
jgi:hypothetical protein